MGDPTALVPTKVFVGGLSWETTEDRLRAHFSKYGPMTDIVVMKDGMTGQSRGFGFVTFETDAAANAALANNPHTIDGKAADTKKAVQQETARKKYP